ncbi:unnamed protein product [Prorocentrum cordatum]|uniref:F5/8 type C domain-containing protein n=1 Tax=Prorocentrum cordatum TaxID=2364126 RepID=A0ABN9PUY0_9DINO|nr:unnamed protein product [Polarella glacialis]
MPGMPNQISQIDSEEQEQFDRLAFISPLIMTESNWFRKVWECVLLLQLLYIGIVFPYKITFIEFRLHAPGDCELSARSTREESFDVFITIFFWIDLFLNFVLTYRGKDNVEIVAPSRIARHYLRGYFGINLLACLPNEVFTPLIEAMDIDPGGCSFEGTTNSAVRLARLQRVTRLARLARLLRIVKILSFLQKSAVIQLLKVLRSLRLLNWITCLGWVVHLLACGWYLVAALHENHLETWPNRRSVSIDESTLFSASSPVQWVHSMYFILTVFTTVGFGDMYPVTVGEILYVVFVMMIGAVVHSIIISEVINLVSEVDEDTRWKRNKMSLLEAYSSHTQLDRDTVSRLTSWVDALPSGRSTFDPEDMRRLLTSGVMPRSLIGDLPDRLFDGQLARNKFMTTCAISCTGGIMPPRFPLLMSTVLCQRPYKAGELVYELHDHAFNLFLVMSGTFAYVCEVTGAGAVDAAKEPEHFVESNSAFKAGGKGSGIKLPGMAWTPSEKHSAESIAGTHATASRSGLEYHQAADGGRLAVINPWENMRSYSSPCARGSVYSALGQSRGAWTPDSSKAREWLQINLGSVKGACGVVVQGHPKRDEWVTRLKVYASYGGVEGWQEVPLVQAVPGPATHHDDKVEFQFREPVATQFIRIEPQECYGRASLRAAVHVLQQRLHPYKVIGKNAYFGEDIITGSIRTATVRCEKDGHVMLLHKQDLGTSGDAQGARLLAEFPQFRRVLRAECLRLQARRKHRLQHVRTGHQYESYAASALQEAWRARERQRSGGGPAEAQPPAATPGERGRGAPQKGPAAAKCLEGGGGDHKARQLVADIEALRADVERNFGAVNATLERLERLVVALPQQGGAPSV